MSGAEPQSMMVNTPIRDRQTDVGLSSTQLVLVYYHLAEITYQTRLSWITAELCPGLAKTYHQPKFRCAGSWVSVSKVYLMLELSSSITEKMSLWIYCLSQYDEFLLQILKSKTILIFKLSLSIGSFWSIPVLK